MNVNNKIGLILIGVGVVGYYIDRLLQLNDHSFPNMLISSGMTLLTRETIREDRL
jgi:hypothetical protein